MSEQVSKYRMLDAGYSLVDAVALFWLSLGLGLGQGLGHLRKPIKSIINKLCYLHQILDCRDWRKSNQPKVNGGWR